MSHDESNNQPRLKRKDLREFYDSVQKSNDQFTDINSKNFDQDLYVNNIIQHKNLKQLLEEETNLVSNIQRLDSECQTLVYDHYDKFIAATDVVRQMKEGSAEMNTQVSNLQEKMTKITKSSELISSDLQGRRGKLNHLLGIHSTLKKLQFLFHLPQKIDECIKDKKFSEGVQCYVETAEVLKKYQNLPSFSAIHKDCQQALKKLNAALKSELAVNESSAQHLALCVDLLLQLGEPSEGLCDDFLKQMTTTLEKDLDHLRTLIESPSDPQSPMVDGRRKSESFTDEEENNMPVDILQFIDVCHDTFVANMWLVISSYKEIFLRDDTLSERRESELAVEKLEVFVEKLIDEYLMVVRARIDFEDNENHDYRALTTALDKFHRRLHAIGQLMNNMGFTQKSSQLIYEAGESRCARSLEQLKENFTSNLTDVRQVLAVLRPSSQDHSPSTQMNEQLTHLVASTASNIKERINSLVVFVQPQNTFALTSDFRHRFSRQLVREGVIVAFFHYITKTLQQFCRKKEKNPSLLLLLSKMSLDLHSSTIHYLMNFCDEQLQLDDKRGLTPYSNLTSVMKETGQKLLDHYVTSEGSSVSQMLRRSVELKDWLGCSSQPQRVRRVMKTFVEEISLADVLVGALYEEGTRKDRSSDSSRRTFHGGGLSRCAPGGGGNRLTVWSSYNSGLDNSFVANLNKLWSERIEIFAPVEFTRISILTGIIKICLKSLLECVRVQTFGRFGFHQVQIDVHYLRTYLWPYVMDEQILYALLDEVLTSASLRTTDPEVMDLKIIESICEQN